jgi:hypothetical protein
MAPTARFHAAYQCSCQHCLLCNSPSTGHQSTRCCQQDVAQPANHIHSSANGSILSALDLHLLSHAKNLLVSCTALEASGCHSTLSLLHADLAALGLAFVVDICAAPAWAVVHGACLAGVDTARHGRGQGQAVQCSAGKGRRTSACTATLSLHSLTHDAKHRTLLPMYSVY